MHKNQEPCANPSSPKLNYDHKNITNNNTQNLKSPPDETQNNPTPPTATRSMLALATGSWLRSRRSRWVFLLFCSPILLPLLFACFPFLCAVEVCIRICRRRQRKSVEDESLRRCEEGCCGCGQQDDGREVGLLQRYLEDQLMLVGSVYDCADDDYHHQDQDDYHHQDQDDCRVPLLR